MATAALLTLSFSPSAHANNLPDGTPILTALGLSEGGVVTDDDVWQDVLDALPNTQKHEESFEDFPDETPLDGLQSSNGEGSVFTIAVDYQDGDGSNADIEVDSGTVFGVSAVDGNRLLKFNINPRANAETRIDVDFTIPVAGFAINIGDFHDGGRDGENLVEIRFDGELV